VVEDFQGNRQELKTLIELSVGDFVCSQQNVVIDKISPEEADDILKLVLNIKNIEGGEKK
jgi:hydrogenase maturation factor